MAARQAARTLLTPSTSRVSLSGRRFASSTTETVKTKVAQNRTTLIYSAGALGAILAGVYVFSGSASEKRKRAIAKIDRMKAASATPSVVAAKASEAKAKSPALDGSAGEEEASEGAFNPETGEINWDCPCLGGMAHGTCGEQFRDAFSCFVFSEAEPKGIDCVDKFNAMQLCFREHPQEYAQVIKEDDESSEEGGADLQEEMRNAQSSGPPGAGTIDKVKAGGQKLKDKAERLVDKTKEAIDGNPSVLPPKHAQEHNENKALKQPKGGDDDHKSSHAAGSTGSTGSGYDENADHHVAGGAGSSSNLTGASGKGKDSLDSEKTPNKSKGEKEPLGRNAAEGSKPSGSDKAHEAHKEGVEKTRSGSDKESSKSRTPSRG